jgi:hypothetical protein
MSFWIWNQGEIKLISFLSIPYLNKNYKITSDASEVAVAIASVVAGVVASDAAATGGGAAAISVAVTGATISAAVAAIATTDDDFFKLFNSFKCCSICPHRAVSSVSGCEDAALTALTLAMVFSTLRTSVAMSLSSSTYYSSSNSRNSIVSSIRSNSRE